MIEILNNTAFYVSKIPKLSHGHHIFLPTSASLLHLSVK